MKKMLRFFSLLFVAIPLSCSSAGSSSVQSTSNIYDIIDRQSISLADCLSQPENHYVVYFYSDTCASCQRIKESVVTFANSSVVKTYFLDTQKPENNIQKCSIDELIVGVNNVSDLYIAGTPTLLEVKDGVTVSNVGGEINCLDLLETFTINAKVD